MTRPTAMIRKLLVMEVFADALKQAAKQQRQLIDDADIDIISIDDTPLDYRVKYKSGGRVNDVTYMKAMLDAEVAGYLANWNKHYDKK